MSNTSQIMFRVEGSREEELKHFVGSLNKKAPEVLEALYDRVFPLYYKAVLREQVDYRCQSAQTNDTSTRHYGKAYLDRLINELNKAAPDQVASMYRSSRPSRIGSIPTSGSAHVFSKVTTSGIAFNRQSPQTEDADQRDHADGKGPSFDQTREMLMLVECAKTDTDAVYVEKQLEGFFNACDRAYEPDMRSCILWEGHTPDWCMRAWQSVEHYLGTWQAFWDWSDSFNLSRGMDVKYFRTQQGFEMAIWHHSLPVDCRARRLHNPPAHFGTTFNITSPEVTFGLRLVDIVLKELANWFVFFPEMGHHRRRRELRWHSYCDGIIPVWPFYDLADWKKTCANGFGERHPFVPPYTYQFETMPWDICSGQSRAQAKEAIMRELEKQVDEQLDKHIQLAEETPYVEKATAKRDTDHFDYLVLYQIKELLFSDVARQVDTTTTSTEPIPKAGKKKVERRETSRVTSAIKDAAKRLIGDRYDEWLRPGQAGRPKSSAS